MIKLIDFLPKQQISLYHTINETAAAVLLYSNYVYIPINPATLRILSATFSALSPSYTDIEYEVAFASLELTAVTL